MQVKKQQLEPDMEKQTDCFPPSVPLPSLQASLSLLHAKGRITGAGGRQSGQEKEDREGQGCWGRGGRSDESGMLQKK